MALVSITVCDVCEDRGKPTTHWRIEVGGEVFEVDLCAEDAEPIATVIKFESAEPVSAPFAAPVKRTATKATPAPAARGRQRSGARVMTLEQIEALKH